MHARFAFLLLAVGLTFSAPACPAGLVVTEIMFHPVSGTGQWVEVYNAGPSAINPSADGIEFSFGGGPSVTVDHDIAVGEHVIFYQQDASAFADDNAFSVAFPDTPNGTKLFGVEQLGPATGSWIPFPTGSAVPGFGFPGLNPRSDQVVIRETGANNPPILDQVENFVDFVSSINRGHSIYLTNYSADNNSAANWAGSQSSLPPGVNQGALSNELSVASPGFFPASNAIPEPSSLAILSTMMLLSATGRRRTGRR